MQPPGFSSTAAYIGWHAQYTRSATAIVEDTLQVTYQHMAAHLAGCVQALEDRSVSPGMLVGIEVRRQRYLHLLLLLACEVIGTSTTSFSAQVLRGDDPVLRHCDVLLLNEAPAVGTLPATLILPPDWLNHLAATPLKGDPLALLRRQGAADGTARIVRTSGTTAEPKATVMSRVTQQRVITRYMDLVPPVIRASPKFLCLYDFTVFGNHMRTLSVLQRGGTVLLAREDQAHGLLGTGAANYVALTVGDMERIVQGALPPPAGHDLQVELIGAAVSSRLHQFIRERLNARIRTFYASNEVQGVTNTNEDNVGTIFPNVMVRIVDEAGHDRPIGETGLIRVKTDTMTEGYFHNPALTAASFIDGWYLTNDVGYMPEPGKLVVLGRADDMLNIGGLKLPPLPIEQAIKRIPGVNDAVVMSIEGSYQVDRLLLTIESDQPAANLIPAASKILAHHVRAFEVMLLPRFPRTETSKVRRQEIKATFLRNRKAPST